MAANKSFQPNVIKQLSKELKNLNDSPPEGITVVVNDDDFSTIFADIKGPAGTPYENGIFRMKLLLSNDFPQSPPKGYFITKIFHPNIATNGEICVNTLKKDWNPSLGLRHVFTVIRCLLIEPFPESALNEQAGKMLLEDYDEYARLARLYTGIHALKAKPKPKTGAICESTSALNVDQTNTVHGDKASFPPTPLNNAPLPSKILGMASQDQNVIPPAPAAKPVEAPVAQKKEAAAAMVKVQADKKKMDARKKSLKRL
ncbi:ubiquitin-conjugating enzyme E2 22 [Phalaenopsis equestris]|uniref:ubiquitin-conjugating enzyme E2 22 n=1 Tax=Phalaenopsis equestris TaxID=78828 RepID=UPI0009E1E7BA|nr:ubiquitin-conjugating enzyme E2 22 [Phalaenopsis equestris]XP_020589812.1 ubiquitin-conjugating enzyme E2 22 [Phalaenopsis equestris]XP_020589813.1 ubiquitin-conjugating enzyme E2 22 [Phalaenopsis equestris]